MYEYCVASACRHRALVEHFGQRFAKPNCGACDVCLDHTRPVPEPLIVGQKILSCVARLREGRDTAYTARILTGANDGDVAAAGHDSLSTWGLLKEEPAALVGQWIEQLAAQGFVRRDLDSGVLKITPAGRALLKGARHPRLRRPLAAGERATPAISAEGPPPVGAPAAAPRARRVRVRGEETRRTGTRA